jgi:hypothetical protein
MSLPATVRYIRCPYSEAAANTAKGVSASTASIPVDVVWLVDNIITERI